MSTRLRKAVLVATVAGLMVIAAGDSGAESPDGFFGGGTVGLGRFSYWDDNWSFAHTSLSLIGHAGMPVGENLAVVLDGWGHKVIGDDDLLGFGCLALQFWPTEKVWLRGGPGFGVLQRCGDCEKHTGFGGMGAVGYVLKRSGGTVVDLNVRYGHGSTGDYKANALSIGVGVTWE